MRSALQAFYRENFDKDLLLEKTVRIILGQRGQRAGEARA